SSIPVDKTTIADTHYLHKNFQYAILDGEELEIMMTTTIIRVEYGTDTMFPQQKNTNCLPPG
ncbi:MAG: hypothetical protein K2L07_12575, partial [Lachnospiraceae bacterium]|nr:hypothetical protein [Lachnospiraceae bacterium]